MSVCRLERPPGTGHMNLELWSRGTEIFWTHGTESLSLRDMELGYLEL